MLCGDNQPLPGSHEDFERKRSCVRYEIPPLVLVIKNL